MDRKLRKILTECIRDIEMGARDVEGCLQRHPDRAAELRPHLELWAGLNAAAKAEPDIGSQQRGQHQLLTTLSEVERGGRKRMIPFLTPALVKAGAVAVAAVLVIGGTAGASAALGGPNVPGGVLSGIGINDASGPDRHREMDREQEMERTSEGPGEPNDSIDHTPEAHREQEMERDREMEKASEGPGEPNDSVDHTPEPNRQQEMESQQEMERTSEGPGEPNEPIDHTPEAHQEQEMESEQTMEGPFEGSGNADDPYRHANGPGPGY